MAPTQESLDDKPEQAALCMGDAPPRAQPLGQHRRQHGAAVLAALGPLDERRHALAVDVAHLQRDHLAHAQARTVGNRQRGLVLQVVHGGDQPLELIGWLAIDGQERDFVDGGFAGAWGSQQSDYEELVWLPPLSASIPRSKAERPCSSEPVCLSRICSTTSRLEIPWRLSSRISLQFRGIWRLPRSRKLVSRLPLMRLLLDESLPRRPRDELVGHSVCTVPECGWSGVKNGCRFRKL